MHRLFHLLLALSVLWCGSHIGEPGEARLPVAQTEFALDAHLLPGDADQSDEAGHAEGAGHHHCPVAPDMPAAASCNEALPADALLFARLQPALTPFFQAPPVQPPSA